MNFIDCEIEKVRKKGRILPFANGTAFEISETKMSGKPTFAHYRFDGSIEDTHKATGIFSVAVAAHGRLVHRNLLTSSRHQIHQFLTNNRDQRLGYRETIRIHPVR